MIPRSNDIVSCPACAKRGMLIFYEATNVPVHSVLLMQTRTEAQLYPKGKIELGFCTACGFISNTAFDAKLHEYSSRYEATQGFSETFNKFHTSLAQRLVDTYDLHQKDIIEIGCDKGEFLKLLCDLGDNRGVGIDPAYVPDRIPSNGNVRFIKDFYSEQYANLNADFIACKMTLEHIQPVFEFVHMVRRSVDAKKKAIIFFQIPNAAYVLRDIAFWDIYYEHCSYFSKGSLVRLFRRCGFDVLAVSTEYKDQYLAIEAKPSDGTSSQILPAENDLDYLHGLVANFMEEYPKRMHRWVETMKRIRRENKKAVIWGAGSKGVAFLTALDITTDVMPYAVDINPHKRGTFMAGSGQEIVLPEFLVHYQPDMVMAMNPMYKTEIQNTLAALGIQAELLTIEE